MLHKGFLFGEVIGANRERTTTTTITLNVHVIHSQEKMN